MAEVTDRIYRWHFIFLSEKRQKITLLSSIPIVIGSINWHFVKKIANFLQVFLNYLYFLLKEEVYVATPVLFPISSWFCGCGFGFLLWSLITNGKVDGAEMTTDQSCITDHNNIDFPKSFQRKGLNFQEYRCNQINGIVTK